MNFEELSELHKKCFGIEASKSDYEEIVNLIDQKILPSYNTTIETQTPPQQQHLATNAGTPNGKPQLQVKVYLKMDLFY